MGKEEAVNNAKFLRPVIDPIGSLSECLSQLDICLALHRLGSGGQESEPQSHSSSVSSSPSSSGGLKNTRISPRGVAHEEKTDELSPRTAAGKRWWLAVNRKVAPMDKISEEPVTPQVHIGKILETDDLPAVVPNKKFTILQYIDRIRAFSAPASVPARPIPVKGRTNSCPPSTIMTVN
jgi:hypothetical protein